MLNFLFADEYGRLTVNIFLSSKSHSGIFSFLKFRIVSLIKFDEKPAILCITLPKWDSIRFAL